MALDQPFHATGVCSPGVLAHSPSARVPARDPAARPAARPDPRPARQHRGLGHASRRAARARRIAERRRLPYLALEDGFIRSLGPAASHPPSSLVVDPVGIYYDATRPSALEAMLASLDCPPEALEEAQAALALILSRRLTRINSAPTPAADELAFGGKPLVLVIDQTLGDVSVELGLAGERQFRDMLEAAIDENPGANVMVKVHPEVAAGRQPGHLAERARQRGIGLIEDDINAFPLLERASRVYTVTSQCGMEALLCGTRVVCFGMPFYAGWGATDDRVRCPRRTRRRTPLEIFALAYGRYARYVDPIRGEACSLGQWLERLAVIKRADERNRGHTECLGFARRQRRAAGAFLRASRGSFSHSREPGRALAAAAARGGRLCSWAGRAPAGLEQAARAAGRAADPGRRRPAALGRPRRRPSAGGVAGVRPPRHPLRSEPAERARGDPRIRALRRRAAGRRAPAPAPPARASRERSGRRGRTRARRRPPAANSGAGRGRGRCRGPPRRRRDPLQPRAAAGGARSAAPTPA